MVKGAYDNPKTRIGLILGTGCNGAYLEKANAVKRWGGGKYDADEVIVDPGMCYPASPRLLRNVGIP